jgi:hypothetical protein
MPIIVIRFMPSNSFDNEAARADRTNYILPALALVGKCLAFTAAGPLCEKSRKLDSGRRNKLAPAGNDADLLVHD